MLGMILLMALVAKNAILLVDYTDTLRERGMARSQAIIEAGATRLRPILMTTFTIVFAMIPLSLKLDAGAESRSPIAVVLMGGVLSSMLLTLVVVPVVYTVLEDAIGWLRALPGLPGRVLRRRVVAPSFLSCRYSPSDSVTSTGRRRRGLTVREPQQGRGWRGTIESGLGPVVRWQGH